MGGVSLPALSLGEGDPLDRPEGAALWPAFKDEAELAKLKADQGSIMFSALYQGDPQPATEALSQRSWFAATYDKLPRPIDARQIANPWMMLRRSSELDLPELTFIAGLDGAWSENLSADYSAIVVWATDGVKFYLADAWRGRVEYVKLKEIALQMYWKWRPQAFMIEDAASGTALLSDMRKTTPIPFVGVKVKGSKETRAEAITPLFESGRCVMPTRELLPIIDDFIDEHVKFPSGRHDDMVDASVHALTRIREPEARPTRARRPPGNAHPRVLKRKRDAIDRASSSGLARNLD